MRITQRAFRNAIVLDLADEFTFASRKDFGSALDKVKQSACRLLILNFEQVTFADSAAIGILALAAQQFELDNRKLTIASPQGTVKQILELANIHKMIPVFSSEEAAAVGDKAA